MFRFQAPKVLAYALIATLVAVFLVGNPLSSSLPAAHAAVPEISSVSPTFGTVQGNTPLEIVGTNLSAATDVSIGSDSLTKVSDDSTPTAGQWAYNTTSGKILARTPTRTGNDRTAGAQLVVVTNADGSSADLVYFTYRPTFGTAGTGAVTLGNLASRSKGKPITRSTTTPYTVTGTDSLSGALYTYTTDLLYTGRTAYSHESVEAPTSGSLTTNTTGSTEEVQVLYSNGTCSFNNVSPANGQQAYCSVFGPDIYTEAFYATQGQSLAFEWKATAGNDDYEVYAFLVSVAGDAIPTPSTSNHTLLMHGMGDNQSTYVTSSASIPTDGLYRFRFVNGTYDYTGAKGIGAKMFIKKNLTIAAENTITFPGPSDVVNSGGYASTTVTLTSTSEAQVTLVASGKCTITSGPTYVSPNTTYVVSNSGGAGTCNLTASQGASGIYSPAADLSRSFDYRATATTPEAPTITSVTGGEDSVSVAFNAPARDGGAAIENYKYSVDGTNYVALSPAATTSPLVISGLTFGQTYSITLKAVNAQGDGTASNAVTGGPSSTRPTVTYNANASQHQSGVVTGSAPSSQTESAGTTVTLSANSGTLARQGFTFDGWNTASNGSGTDYEPGETLTLSSSVTLYAQWGIPEAARLFGLTESSVRKETIVPVEDSDGSPVTGAIRGITTNGSSLFFLPGNQSATAGIVREVGFDGVLIEDHVVSGAGNYFQGTSFDKRDLTYSSGCIFIREDGTTNSKLYCIDTSTWSMSEVTVPTQVPPGGSTAVGFLPGNFWLDGNLIDFPDGRIGAVSRANWNSLTSPTYLDTIAMTAGTGPGECPTSYHCKILRLYSVSGSGASATLTFSEDIVLADNESGWPSDDHGIATDGTYLYQSHFDEGYKSYALQSGAPSYVAFNGNGSGSCGADTGVSGGLCEISGWSKSGLTVGNATYFGRDHVNKRYIMGDYDEPQFVVTTVATDQPVGVGTVNPASAPRSVSGSGGNAQATISWQAPSSNGGSAVSSYAVTASPGGATCSTATLSCTVSGLTNGTVYTFTVVALNNGGTSPSASSGSVIPSVPSPSTGGSSSGGTTVTSPVVAPASPAPPRIITPTQPTPRPTILQGPVTTPGRGFDPNIGTRATIGGAPATVAKRALPSGGLSVEAGAFQFGLNLTNPTGGGTIDNNNPSNTPELRVPTGQSTSFNGGGLLPGSQLQVWLPGPTGNTPKELARVPVRPDGTFETELSFTSRQSETPVPIGRQVMQVAGFDENGNQTVVDMTINVAQGPVAPELNQAEDSLPQLSPGSSLATSAGLPTAVNVIPIPEQDLLTIGDGQWIMSVGVDGTQGAIKGSSEAPVIRMTQSSQASASGDGFMPGTTASVWMFSEPTLMATVTVDEAGAFTTEFLVDPQFLPAGGHTLQIQGVGVDGFIKSANLGVVVDEPISLTGPSSFAVVFWAVGIFIAILAVLLVVFLLRRRRA